MTRVTVVFPHHQKVTQISCSHPLTYEQLSPFGGACVSEARQEMLFDLQLAPLSKGACKPYILSTSKGSYLKALSSTQESNSVVS